MRYLQSALLSVMATLISSVGVASPPTALSSFAELFGVEESLAPAIYGSESTRCLSNALEDFNRALSGQEPIHSKSQAFPQLLDGGTTLWTGDCYVLTVYKSLTSYRLPDGAIVNGFVVGPSLQLKLTPSASESHPIGRTRFLFVEKRAAT